MPPPSKDDFDEGLENFFDLQSVPEAQELGSTERTAELAQTRPQGPKLLSEVCRRVREAAEKQFEQEIAEMGPTGNVAWFLSKALNTGLCCVVAPVPRFELNAFDPVEGTCLHFATSQELPSAALALLSCADFDPSVSKKRERDESTALHLAAANGQEAVVQALLNRSDFAELVAAMDKDLGRVYSLAWGSISRPLALCPAAGALPHRHRGLGDSPRCVRRRPARGPLGQRSISDLRHEHGAAHGCSHGTHRHLCAAADSWPGSSQ
ncbi:Ankyrin-3 [Durusdinium trenchii]|uniref:Ankyrin-3 n=1 Tax=Durusdinium trenchii TaxID=1381693 RepID=A0ABP0P9Q8_9DINO